MMDLPQGQNSPPPHSDAVPYLPSPLPRDERRAGERRNDDRRGIDRRLIHVNWVRATGLDKRQTDRRFQERRSQNRRGLESGQPLAPAYSA